MRRLQAVVLIAVLAVGLTAGTGIAAAAPTPVKPGTAKPAQFPAPQSCGCHAALIEQWSKSMHSKALDDPIYKAKVADADAATNGKLGAFCDTCHDPAATMTGELAKGGALSAGTSGGIGCSWCHQVVGMAPGDPGNTSQLVEPNGVMHAQLKNPTAPHAATYSALYASSAYCGGCHNVNHPVNGMHLESTYREYLAGPYAKQGVNCQDCHMSSQPGQIGPSQGVAAAGGAQRPNIYTMSFSGAQVGLGNAVNAKALLQSAATVKLSSPQIVAAGASAPVTVTVTNVGAGHYLPTGLTEVREMWLELVAENADGSDAVVATKRYGTVLQDKDGKSPVELWEATSIKSDVRIAPKASDVVAFDFTMPQGADASEITARLMYRSAPDELAKKANADNPTTVMASASNPVYASDEAKRAAAQRDAVPGTSYDRMSLVVAVVALLAMAAMIAFFARRGRRA